MKFLHLILFSILIFLPVLVRATIVESNGSGGGDWTAGSSWNGGSTPSNGDTVVILAGDVITISTNLSFNGVIQVYGTLEFDKGKISMDASSAIQLAEGSSIVALGSGQSNQISIGGSSNKLSTDDINSLATPNQVTEESVAGGGGCAETGGCEDNPLPVEILYLTADRIGKGVQIRWATIREENFEYFTLERASDGKQFHNLAKIFSETGFSDTKKEYVFFDEMPLNGYSFYRLKATDFDGFTEYHGIVSVRMDNIQEHIRLFPNPVQGQQVSINFSGKNDAAYKLLSFTGEVLQTGSITQGIGEITFTSKLTPGIYFIQVEYFGSLLTSKLIVK